MRKYLLDIYNRRLHNMLRDRSRWSSMRIDYAEPHVDRLWTQDGENRVSLHCIQPCREGEPMRHPHLRESAALVRAGVYGHRVFDPEGNRIAAHCGMLQCGDIWVMELPKLWHEVDPETEVYSLMVTGKLFEHPETMPVVPETTQGPLSPERFEELYQQWRALIPPPKALVNNPWDE